MIERLVKIFTSMQDFFQIFIQSETTQKFILKLEDCQRLRVPFLKNITYIVKLGKYYSKCYIYYFISQVLHMQYFSRIGNPDC